MKESITTNREITRKIHTLESPPEIGYQAAPLILLFLFLTQFLLQFPLLFELEVQLELQRVDRGEKRVFAFLPCYTAADSHLMVALDGVHFANKLIRQLPTRHTLRSALRVRRLRLFDCPLCRLELHLHATQVVHQLLVAFRNRICGLSVHLERFVPGRTLLYQNNGLFFKSG